MKARLVCAVFAALSIAATNLSCAPALSYSPPPVYDHIVVVIEENHSAYQLTGCVYLNSLAARGASFLAMHALTHPSQPNYIALFSGSTQGVTDDGLHTITAPNLASSLSDAGRSFAGYSEGLPVVDFAGASSGRYVRKHAPWVSFSSVPAGANQPFTSFPSGASPDFSALPTVSFVIPDLDHDMHDGTITQADTWLAQNLEDYARWAVNHNSLLIVTFDEPNGNQSPAFTPITTILVGAGVLPGTRLSPAYTLYSLLRLIEDCTGLPTLGLDATAPRIVGAWR